MIIQLEGIDRYNPVRILMTDTSFTGQGINQVDTVNKRICHQSEQLGTTCRTDRLIWNLSGKNERLVENGTQAGVSCSVVACRKTGILP